MGMNVAEISVRQTIDMPFTQLIDEVDENTTYIGKAPSGNAGNGALAIWQIQKISKAGTVTTIAWASGDALFTHKWTERITPIVYS